jgi:membrane peptidoglycan carboxypeptidase
MGGMDPHGPYGIVAAVMHTSLQRRQRHRRNGAARRGRGGGSARRAALAIPLLLFSSFLVLGGVGFVGTVSAYAYYSRDLPDPTKAFADLAFEQPSIVYDRTGEIELARFGVLRRELATFEQIPPELIDATTAIEDKDFWTNPGFDITAVVSAGLDTIAGRPRGASTITQQLVRARLLPEGAFEGSVYDRKIREIIQSIRLTQAYPGEDGKKRIMAAYLNQNFYGNQSYGVKAASIGYFGKDVSELTLAQYAILAAIPQSPSKYDLMRNAVRECAAPLNADETCPQDQVMLVVPSTAEIVGRRNRILELMKTRSVLSGADHTLAEYDAAKDEPVILTPQKAPPWKAPHLVWQVRTQLGAILCGEDQADTCEKVDTDGYRVTTTLDWKMQQTVDKWLYLAARTPNFKDPKAIWTQLKIPKADQTWLTNLKRRTINNAAAGIIDYRTGEVLAVAGSAGYYLEGNKKFQPQFDVFNDGYRQPGSAIKPLNYIVGLDDHTLTASTMFMHVVTNFAAPGKKQFAPKEADNMERGPVRLRSALQFSFNIASIKAGLIIGLQHAFAQFKEFGLTFLPSTGPVISQSIGTVETHPIELLAGFGAIANGGVLMPRQVILEIRDKDGNVVYPTPEDSPIGKRVATPQASYIMTDILAGNTIKSVNPFWGKWQILEKTDNGNVRRPAAYKTGTTDDYKDVAAYGYLAPPEDPNAPALAVGVWMGNSDSTPNGGSLSLDSSAPVWSRILTEVSQDMPIAKFKRPDGLVDVTVDAFSGLLPGPGTVKTVKELFIKGTEPKRQDDLHVELQIDQATGLLWQDGCTGPMVTGLFLDFSGVESRFPQWQPYTQGWAARAARGPGVVGGPKKTRTAYFYGFGFRPFGATWGGKFAPTEVCQPVQPTCGPGGGGGNPFNTPPPCETPPSETPDPGSTPKPTATSKPKPNSTPTPGPALIPTLPLSGPGEPAAAATLAPILPLSLLLIPFLAIGSIGRFRRRR